MHSRKMLWDHLKISKQCGRAFTKALWLALSSLFKLENVASLDILLTTKHLFVFKRQMYMIARSVKDNKLEVSLMVGKLVLPFCITGTMNFLPSIMLSSLLELYASSPISLAVVSLHQFLTPLDPYTSSFICYLKQ